MYLGPMLLFSAFSSLFYVPGFMDIPFAVLTPSQLLSQCLFLIFGLIALAALVFMPFSGIYALFGYVRLNTIRYGHGGRNFALR